MRRIKAQAVEILQDIPDDKIFPVIDILKVAQLNAKLGRFKTAFRNSQSA